MTDTEHGRTAPAGVRPPLVSKRQVVAVVVRRGGPKLVEATVIPGVLFYACLVWGGLGLAYLTALTWVYVECPDNPSSGRRSGVPEVPIGGRS